jgi:excisionase family DNA binding protein
MTTATQLTVSEAAEHVGVTRQTIFKQIKAGKLSATQNRQGHMQVNVVELLRVYGELQSPQQVAQNRINRQQQANPATATALLQIELERTKMQLELANERIQELKETVREVKDEKQQLLVIVDRQTLLLAAPRPARAKPAAKPSAPPPVVKKPAAKAAARPAAKTLARTKAKPAAAKKPTTRPAKAPTKKATRK